MNYLHGFRLFSFALLLCFVSGCSFTGKLNESIVTAGAAGWKAQPLAVRQSYPLWFQSVYITAEMQTSDIKNWELYLVSKKPLGESASLAYAEIRYSEGKETKVHPFSLKLVNTTSPDHDQKYFRYTYQFENDAAEFYSDYLSRRFSYEVSPLELHYLQPLYLTEVIPQSAVIRVEYGILPEYGAKTVGELMRSMFNLNKKDWQKFCQDPVYIYDKSSACGEVKINDKTSSL